MLDTYERKRLFLFEFSIYSLFLKPAVGRIFLLEYTLFYFQLILVCCKKFNDVDETRDIIARGVQQYVAHNRICACTHFKLVFLPIFSTSSPSAHRDIYSLPWRIQHGAIWQNMHSYILVQFISNKARTFVGQVNMRWPDLVESMTFARYLWDGWNLIFVPKSWIVPSYLHQKVQPERLKQNQRVTYHQSRRIVDSHYCLVQQVINPAKKTNVGTILKNDQNWLTYFG